MRGQAAFDRCAPAARLEPSAGRGSDAAARRCAKSSDWFWWFGDYNPAESVARFDELYRAKLRACTRPWHRAARPRHRFPSATHRALRRGIRRAARPARNAHRTAMRPRSLLTPEGACQPARGEPRRRSVTDSVPCGPDIHRHAALRRACPPARRQLPRGDRRCPCALLRPVPAHAGPLSRVPLRGAFQRPAARRSARALPRRHGAARGRWSPAARSRCSARATAEPVLAAIPYRDRLRRSTRCRQARRALRRAPARRLADRAGLGVDGGAGARRLRHPLCRPSTTTTSSARGEPQDELDGYFTTEEDGRTLDLFPISEALRYRIPFAPAGDAVAYIEVLAAAGRRAAAIYFDDIEKFGIWPETYEWVYEKGWLREFIEARARVAADPHVDVRRYHARERTARRRLSADHLLHRDERMDAAGARGAATYADLVDAEKRGRPLRRAQGASCAAASGATSCRATRKPTGCTSACSRCPSASPPAAGAAQRRAAYTLLHRAQANDAYWHGLFGGLYLPHLRRGVWRHLLLLEAGLDRVSPRARAERLDLDHDGVDDVFFCERRSAGRRAHGRQCCGGRNRRLCAWRRTSATRCAVMPSTTTQGAGRRRIRARCQARALPRRTIASRSSTRSAPDELVPDAAPRHAFRDRWHGAGGDAEALSSYAETRVEGTARGVRGARRRDEDRQDDCARRRDRQRALSRARRRGWPASTTLDLAMPSCDGVAGRYLVGGSIRGGFGQPLDLERAERGRARRPAHGTAASCCASIRLRASPRGLTTRCRSRRKASSA